MELYRNRRGDIVNIVWTEQMDVTYPVYVKIISTQETYQTTIAYQTTIEGFFTDTEELNELDIVEELTQSKYPELYLWLLQYPLNI